MWQGVGDGALVRVFQLLSCVAPFNLNVADLNISGGKVRLRLKQFKIVMAEQCCDVFLNVTTECSFPVNDIVEVKVFIILSKWVHQNLCGQTTRY